MVFDQIGKLWQHFFSSTQELADQELQEESKAAGGTATDQVEVRKKAVVAGRLTQLTVSASADAPRLTAVLSDGSGHIELIWIGRREIPGVETGVQLKASGMVTVVDDKLAIFNPDYELLS